MRGALGDHRWRLVLIAAVAMMALVALAAGGSRDRPHEGNVPEGRAGKAAPDALEQVPSVFGDIEANEDAYAVAASRGGNRMITKGLGCSKLLRDRSVSVDLVFPNMLPSASLSQHTVFVARFRGGYWAWGTGH